MKPDARENDSRADEAGDEAGDKASHGAKSKVGAQEQHAKVSFPPPAVFIAGLVLGVLLHRFVLPLDLPLSVGLRSSLGAVTALLGLTLLGGAAGLFKRTGQDPRPWTPTPALVTTGVYRFTRNPMYLAMAFLQLSFGIGFANGWVIVFIVPVLAVIYVIAIKPEERYLAQKFGETYLHYKDKVRRWL